MSKREFKDAALTRLDHPLFAPARLAHVHTTFLPAQDDISHPDSERELGTNTRPDVMIQDQESVCPSL